MKFTKALSLLTLSAITLSACNQPTSNIDLSNTLGQPTDVNTLSASNKNGSIIPGEFIVKFKTTAKNGPSVLSSVGATKIRDLKLTNTQLIKMPSTNGSNDLQNNPNIEWIEPNRIISLPKVIKDNSVNSKELEDGAPNDPLFPQQYAHKVSDSIKGWALAKKNNKGTSTIAIIDTGIDGEHPDLKAKLLPGYDAYGQGKEYKDKQGHGTHCAGIAAGIGNNGIGVIGYSPDSKLIGVKVLQDNGSGTYAAVADGIAWAAKSKADVLSMSLGGPSSSQAMEDAINLAIQNNKIVIAASGNDGDDSLGYPAAIKGVMAVGATDANDKIADFSQYGQHLAISAPGVNIMSTFPTYASGMPGTNYGKISGTSMATPGVAGLAGLLKSVNPSLTGKQLRDIIEKSADDLGEKGWDKYFGNGRINTLKAVEMASGSSKR